MRLKKEKFLIYDGNAKVSPRARKLISSTEKLSVLWGGICIFAEELDLPKIDSIKIVIASRLGGDPATGGQKQEVSQLGRRPRRRERSLREQLAESAKTDADLVTRRRIRTRPARGLKRMEGKKILDKMIQVLKEVAGKHNIMEDKDCGLILFDTRWMNRSKLTDYLEKEFRK